MNPIVVSYGAGVNSTAMLCGLVWRGPRPDVILFADTGGEMPETYEYIPYFSEWLRLHGFPSITVIRRESPHGTLEQECHNNQTLPSKAFGFSGCSVKWKRQPMDAWIKQNLDTSAGVVRFIGIHYGEQHRGQIPDDAVFRYRFPLIEWQWDQQKCIEAIQQQGLKIPPKSACYFCPAAKKQEVLALSRNHPDLFARAVAIEEVAKPNLGAVRGLGRHWSWREIVEDYNAYRDAQNATVQTCLCFDQDMN